MMRKDAPQAAERLIPTAPSVTVSRTECTASTRVLDLLSENSRLQTTVLPSSVMHSKCFGCLYPGVSTQNNQTNSSSILKLYVICALNFNTMERGGDYRILFRSTEDIWQLYDRYHDYQAALATLVRFQGPPYNGLQSRLIRLLPDGQIIYFPIHGYQRSDDACSISSAL